MSINGALRPVAAVVAVDVGKTKAAVLVSDASGAGWSARWSSR